MKVDTTNMKPILKIELWDFVITFLAAVFIPFTIGVVIGWVAAGGHI